MIRTLLITSTFLLAQTSIAQWAGATSNGGSERAPIKQKSTSNVNINEKRGRLTLGLGRGGYAQDLCEVALPLSPDFGSGYITNYTSNPDPSGFTFFMSGIQKTSYKHLWVGFEWGIGYAGKTVEYEYYTSLGNYYTGSTDIDYLHMGVGIPIRYYFVESEDIDLYAQGVFGYGFVGDVTNDDDIPGIYYGGGSFGGRWTILFAELGYNSTGFLRFGLSIPTAK